MFLCRLAEELFLLTKTCTEFVQHCLYGIKPWHFEHGTEEKCTLHIDSLFQNCSLKSSDLFNSKTSWPLMKVPKQVKMHILS